MLTCAAKYYARNWRIIPQFALSAITTPRRFKGSITRSSVGILSAFWQKKGHNNEQRFTSPCTKLQAFHTHICRCSFLQNSTSRYKSDCLFQNHLPYLSKMYPKLRTRIYGFLRPVRAETQLGPFRACEGYPSRLSKIIITRKTCHLFVLIKHT